MPLQRRTVTISSTTSTARSPVTIVRFLAAIFACVTFSLIAHKNAWYGTIGDLCMFCWCFCFAVTIIILVVEFAGLQSRMPVSWRNFPITFAMFAVLMCLSATIIYPTHFLQPKGYNSEYRTYQIVAIVFSSLTTLAYIIEVSLTRAKPGEVTGYMATVPGLLKVVETYVAIIIFVFISDPPQYTQYDALKWCLAVYCICFILSVVIIILCIGECTGWLPCAFNKFLSGYALLAVLLYASAMIIWPIYHFDSKYGNTKKTSGCSDFKYMCDYDRRVGIAVLTAINLLAYVLDLIFSARLVFITTTSI